ncbi:RNA polymerase sigma factor [Rhodothermus bifroesti]|uniref:RNA polymerase sigma-70 factor n=1 Tax=Rhodothermus marinus TaxID=29549 RepID=A0A7V2B295_RHOMR|nr:ECF RNA polymerase sigma-E factor [bacterium HR18]
MTDDFQTLCERLRASDQAALGMLFRCLRIPLLRYVQAIVGDSGVAHDLIQDVFLDLWMRRTTLNPAQPLRPYLYRMARNRALRHLRDERRRARKRAEHLPANSTTEPLLPDTLAETHQLETLLARWLEELPERQREALVLSRWHGLSHREIAQVMGISPRTVNNHLLRALETLQRRLQALALTP